jgi:hypothetical protein
VLPWLVQLPLGRRDPERSQQQVGTLDGERGEGLAALDADVVVQLGVFFCLCRGGRPRRIIPDRFVLGVGMILL